MNGAKFRRVAALIDDAAARTRSFAPNARGGIAVLGAILVVPLVYLAGGATDYARSVQVKNQLQDAMDAAVLSGARAYNSPAAAAGSFQTNFGSGVVVGPPVFTDLPNGNFQGQVQAQSPTAFLGIMGISSFNVHATATSAVRKAVSNVCLTALDTTGPGLVRSGAGTVHAPDCKLDVRSTASPAAEFGGSGGTVNALDVCIRGTATTGPIPPRTRLGCTLEIPLKITFPDVVEGACTAAKTNVTINTWTPMTLEPGTYCGPLRIDGSGTITMNPGTYILRPATPGGAAGIWYTGSGSLIGNNVMLYFTGSTSTFDLSGSGKVNMTPLASGKFAGVLFHEQAGLPISTVRLHRSDGATMRGLIHLPSRRMQVSGSSSAGSTAVVDEVTMVINRLTTSGSGSWSVQPGPISAVQFGEPYLVE